MPKKNRGLLQKEKIAVNRRDPRKLMEFKNESKSQCFPKSQKVPTNRMSKSISKLQGMNTLAKRHKSHRK